jgi:hypothetical protein
VPPCAVRARRGTGSATSPSASSCGSSGSRKLLRLSLGQPLLCQHKVTCRMLASLRGATEAYCPEGIAQPWFTGLPPLSFARHTVTPD